MPNKIHILKFLFLVVTLSSITSFLSLPQLPTFLWWIVYGLLIAIFITYIPKSGFFKTKDSIILPVFLLLIWNIVSILRGVFVAENYWEWKNLIYTSSILLIPFSVFAFANKKIVSAVFNTWLIYAPIIFILFIPFIIRSDFVGRYMVPFMFLWLFFPAIKLKWKIIIIFITLLVFVAGFDARSNIIRFAVAAILGLSLYFKSLLSIVYFKIIRFFLIILPIIMLVLAYTGLFNIFKIEDYYKKIEISNRYENTTENLSADTRTFLYDEVISSAINNGYWIWGRTPARGYDSQYFGSHLAEELNTGKMERFASEVSLHNIFTWTGLIGLILYFWVFTSASYFAIYKSRNYYMKIIGIFVAFRWLYGWIEDFTNFDLQYLVLWLLIAMCYSKDYRMMTNQQFRIWINSFFDRKIQFKTKIARKKGILNESK